MIDQFGSITLSARQMVSRSRPRPTRSREGALLPAAAGQDPVEVVFTVDRAIPPSSADSRELGIIVARLDAE